jgi:hypothetical protein
MHQDKQLESYKTEVARLSSKLGQYSRMGGQAAVQPNWQAPAPVYQAPAPVQAAQMATPMVEVAASGAEQQHLNPFTANPVLAGLRSYVETSCNNKVMNSHFSRSIPVTKHQ